MTTPILRSLYKLVGPETHSCRPAWGHLSSCRQSWNVRGCVTKPISSVPLISEIFSIAKTHVSYWISCLYAVAPVKYKCDSNNLRGTFDRSKILLTEKLTNGALVTPTPDLYAAHHGGWQQTPWSIVWVGSGPQVLWEFLLCTEGQEIQVTYVYEGMLKFSHNWYWGSECQCNVSEQVFQHLIFLIFMPFSLFHLFVPSDYHLAMLKYEQAFTPQAAYTERTKSAHMFRWGTYARLCLHFGLRITPANPKTICLLHNS